MSSKEKVIPVKETNGTKELTAKRTLRPRKQLTENSEQSNSKNKNVVQEEQINL
ncbi:hypothetical protein NWE60_02420 [Mycoplasmopsis felis]|nr:hypothetical protein [Mycoplasmopsis felis]WAM01452.1 hypothetical protein NWE60_02420 [Mycoplasmopsis felis]